MACGVLLLVLELGSSDEFGLADVLVLKVMASKGIRSWVLQNWVLQMQNRHQMSRKLTPKGAKNCTKSSKTTPGGPQKDGQRAREAPGDPRGRFFDEFLQFLAFLAPQGPPKGAKMGQQIVLKLGIFLEVYFGPVFLSFGT